MHVPDLLLDESIGIAELQQMRDVGMPEAVQRQILRQAGVYRRRTPSTNAYTPTASRTAAWAPAARTSARRQPQVRSGVGGRRARLVAMSAISSPDAAVSM